MRPLSSGTWALVLGIVLISPRFGLGQTRADGAPAAPSSPTADYPKDRAGVLIEGSDWTPIDAAMPSKTRAKGGIAQSLS